VKPSSSTAVFTVLQSIVRKFHAKRPARQRLRRKVLAVPCLLLVLAVTILDLAR
jgi:hypothetical protein